ncbi:hypothetical protein Bca4012_020301 [Brassica carinata]
MNKNTKKKRNENGDAIPPPKRRKHVNLICEEPNDHVLQDITNSHGNIAKDARSKRRLKLLQKRKFADLQVPNVNQTGIDMSQSQHENPSASQITAQSNQAADFMPTPFEQSGYPSKSTCREKRSLLRLAESVTENTHGSDRYGKHTNHVSPSVQNFTQSTLSYTGVLTNPTQTLRSEGPRSEFLNTLRDIPGSSSAAISVDSDSSDGDDDLWDCSSTEGIESGIDSDTCDDNSSEIKKRDAQTKFELMNKAEKALTEMFGQLQKKKPPVTTSSPLVSTQYKGAKDMFSPLQKKKSAVTVSAPIVSTQEIGDKG